MGETGGRGGAEKLKRQVTDLVIPSPSPSLFLSFSTSFMKTLNRQIGGLKPGLCCCLQEVTGVVHGVSGGRGGGGTGLISGNAKAIHN